MVRKLFVVLLPLYLAFLGLVALTGVYDPPGQVDCGGTWCGMVGFLGVFVAGLPWSFVLLVQGLVKSDAGMYWACWGCAALNAGILGLLARSETQSRSAP